MAQLGMFFDANSVPVQTEYSPLPAGDYVMHIVRSELKPTKDGTGQYLELEFDVLEGAYAGRKFWDRLNLWNKNPTTVEIANRSLGSLCRAVGKLQIADSEELHFTPVRVKMKLTPRKDNPAQLQNNASYFPLNEAPTAPVPAPVPASAAPAAQRPPYAAPAAPQAPAAPAAAGGPAKPWERHRRAA